MGERKGTNKYYPPDYDPTKGGLNKFMGTHALRERARKLHLGILIIRFEMPYNIWCEGCKNHIGMGVRYNAEKTKVGMYYSTPVYQFRMKCHLCDNHFEMKTDPANLDYVIVNGARRQENRWDPTENGQVVPDDKRVIRQLADDAMFRLQHGKEDQTKLTGVTPTLAKLEDLQERWKDDYMANRALRDQFRSRKKELKLKEDKDNEILQRNSLNIKLLEESEDDAKIASLIRLQPTQSSEERQIEKRMEIDKKSSFPFPSASSSVASINQLPQANIANIPEKSRAKVVEKQRLSLGISLASKTNNKINKGSSLSKNVSAASTSVYTTTAVSSSNSSEKMCNAVSAMDKSSEDPSLKESSISLDAVSTINITKGESTDSFISSTSSFPSPLKSSGLSLISCDYPTDSSSGDECLEN